MFRHLDSIRLELAIKGVKYSGTRTVSRPDPLPTVVLEAMASSKPIVGYNHGGVSEMVVQNYNGILSTPREPSGLTESIDNLLGNESKLKEYGNNSLKLQESKFSIITFSKNFNDLYESI